MIEIPFWTKTIDGRRRARQFSRRFEALGNRLAGKQQPPDWMILAVLIHDKYLKVWS